jgi:hypothetical protein
LRRPSSSILNHFSVVLSTREYGQHLLFEFNSTVTGMEKTVFGVYDSELDVIALMGQNNLGNLGNNHLPVSQGPLQLAR